MPGAERSGGRSMPCGGPRIAKWASESADYEKIRYICNLLWSDEKPYRNT